MFSEIKGFLHLAITEPSIKKQFYRVAWAQFTEDTDLEEVLRKLNNTKVSRSTDQVRLVLTNRSTPLPSI